MFSYSIITGAISFAQDSTILEDDDDDDDVNSTFFEICRIEIGNK